MLRQVPCTQDARIEATLTGCHEIDMVFAIVKPEAHFVKVGLQMLCANTMPCLQAGITADPSTARPPDPQEKRVGKSLRALRSG